MLGAVLVESSLSYLGFGARNLTRLPTDGQGLLDMEGFGPRKAAITLIWPLQAPMIDEARYALFEDVRIKSARPEGTDILRMTHSKV